MSVSLSVFSEWERALTLYGWLLNNFFTDVLFSSGIVIAVIIVVLISIYFASNRAGDGGKTSQRKLEIRTLIIVLVLLFSFFPIFKIDEVKVLDLSNDCQEYGKHAVFEDMTIYEDLKQELIVDTNDVKIPLLWALLHKIGGGIYYRILDGLDCFTDWGAVETVIRTNKIQDPALLNEYYLFAEKCYGAARYQYKQQGHQSGGASPTADDLAYLGSRYYLDTAGYYDAFLLPTQLQRWQPNAVSSCVAWWLGDATNKGLRAILLEQATAQLPSVEATQILALGDDEVEDQIIKAMLKSNPPEFTAPNTPNVADPVNPPYSTGSGLVGLSERVSETFNQTYFLKRIVAYAQPVVLLALYFFIPLFLSVTGFSVKAILYYATWILSVQAMPMIYTLVAALDAKATESLYQGIGLFNVNMDRLIIAYTFSYLPLALSIAYFIALTLAIKRSIYFVDNHKATEST